MPDVQILAWLKTKARVIEAEEHLSSILDNAEQWVKSLRDRSSTTFDQKNWPDSATVAAALRECREAERALDGADAALSPADRKLLKSIPDS
jgi:hypothetical protein